MTVETNIMWRKVSITIPDEVATNLELWVIAQQRVYVKLWDRAGRGRDAGKNHIGDKGDISLNMHNGSKILVNYVVLDIAKDNDEGVIYPKGINQKDINFKTAI